MAFLSLQIGTAKNQLQKHLKIPQAANLLEWSRVIYMINDPDYETYRIFYFFHHCTGRHGCGQ